MGLRPYPPSLNTVIPLYLQQCPQLSIFFPGFPTQRYKFQRIVSSQAVHFGPVNMNEDTHAENATFDDCSSYSSTAIVVQYLSAIYVIIIVLIIM